MDGGGGTPRPVLLTGAKTGLGCLISFQLPMGFQKVVVINLHAADGGCERDVVHRMNEGYRAWGALKSVSNIGLG